MAEVSHSDLLHRVEEVEKEVAVLDVKIDGIKEDVKNNGKATLENGRLAREVSTQIKTLGRILISLISLIGAGVLVLRFLADVV